MAVARQRIHLPPRAWRRALGFGLSGRIWSGDASSRLERAFADFIGTPDAVLVPSGRAGLRFIFDALNLERGAEVICSAFAYPVVPHLARSLGFKVRFADCELPNLGMDPEALASVISDRTKVVIATHLFGVPCQIREIRKLSESRGATLIEDCAHCYGASVDGRSAGAFGSVGYFSFETSKPINTMGGGIVSVSDPKLAQRIREAAAKQEPKRAGWLVERLARTTFEAIVTHPMSFNLAVYPALRLLASRKGSDERYASGYHADETTMSGRMGRFTNLQATLGLDQMATVAPQLERRVANARRLIDRVKDSVWMQCNDEEGVRSNYMLVTALVPRLDEVSQALLRLGVDTKHRYMRDCSGLAEDKVEFPRAAQAEREVLHLPAYPELGEATVDRVADNVLRVVRELGVERASLERA